MFALAMSSMSSSAWADTYGGTRTSLVVFSLGVRPGAGVGGVSLGVEISGSVAWLSCTGSPARGCAPVVSRQTFHGADVSLGLEPRVSLEGEIGWSVAVSGGYASGHRDDWDRLYQPRSRAGARFALSGWHDVSRGETTELSLLAGPYGLLATRYPDPALDYSLPPLATLDLGLRLVDFVEPSGDAMAVRHVRAGLGFRAYSTATNY